MSHIFRFILLAALVSTALSCGKNRKKGNKGPLNNNPDQCSSGAVPCLVGDGVQTTPYTPGSDQPGDCSQLKCDGESSCCWTNNQPPADQLNWVKGSGQTDSAKMQKNFQTSTAPSGGFFLTASDVAGTDSQTAQLYSCPITCANGDIKVSLRHWASKGTKVQVCSGSDPASAPSGCQDLSSNGQQDTVTIPKGENVRVFIQAVGFTEPTGSAAMVDDIDVQCEPCPETTTPTEAPTTAGPTPAPAGAPPCKEINCDFESGSPCAYQPASSGGTATENWGAKSAPYQNRLTGIPKPANDGKNKFGACYTKKKGEKTSLETNANFDKDYVVRYRYYKATEGQNFKCCCDDESKCPKNAGNGVQTSDYRSWKTESIMCPAGTKKVIFICENEKGASEGACGLDEITLLQSTGGDPTDASQPAC